MTRTTGVFVALCVAGVALGWWLMATLVRTGGTRPELVQRIGSLAAPGKLPAFAGSEQQVLDALESPGGAVWALLGTPGSSGTANLCEFPRQSEGGVAKPDCARMARSLGGDGWRLVLGGADPVLMAPDTTEPLGAIAVRARSGAPVSIQRLPGGALSVAPNRGSRRLRSFRVTNKQGARQTLAQASPREGSYVGPITGFAATSLARPEGAGENSEICAMPSGDIQVQRQTPGVPNLRGREEIEVSFMAKGETFAQTSATIPAQRLLDGGLSCGPSTAYLTWLGTDGRLNELSCGVNGCDHTSTTLSDVPKSRVRALARVGDNTAVIWQDEQGRPLVRLGRVERFTQAPTAPLFEGPAPRRFEVSASLSTGHSWLLFVKLPELKLIQLYSDGKLQALSPAATSH